MIFTWLPMASMGRKSMEPGMVWLERWVSGVKGHFHVSFISSNIKKKCLFHNQHFYWRITAFTILCWFPLYNVMNQLYVSLYPLSLLPPSHPPSHPSRWSQSSELSSLHYRAASCCCCLATWSFPTMDCSPPGSSVCGISHEEYWSGLPFPSPGYLPNPGIELLSPALAGEFFNTEPPENLPDPHPPPRQLSRKYKIVQLTLEQHRFKLCGSIYAWIFLNKYIIGPPYLWVLHLGIQPTTDPVLCLWAAVGGIWR